MNAATFVEQCLGGSASLDDIDEFVAAWHGSESDDPLWAYLGMDQAEYRLWVENPEILPAILFKHRFPGSADTPTLALAARNMSGADADRIRVWLERREPSAP